MRRPSSLLPRLPASPAFRRFLGARLATSLAGNAAPVLLTLTVLAHGGSFGTLGLVLGLGSLPGIVAVLASGRLFRRVAAPRVLFWLDAAAAIVTGVLALVDLEHGLRTPLLAAASFMIAMAQSLAYPATGLIVPQLLPPADLQAGNALRSLTGSTAGIVGPAAATLLLLTCPEPVAWAAVAVGFVLGAVLIRRVVPPAGPHTGLDDESSRADDELGAHPSQGWAYFWSRRWLSLVVVLAGVWHVLAWAFVLVLGPVVLRADHGSGTSWGVFETVLGAGGVVGGLVGGRVASRRLAAASVLCLVPGAVVGLAFAVRAPLIVVLGLGAVTGVALGTAGVLWPTALQALVPRERLAQMFSYDYLLSEAVMPCGLLLAPVAAARLGPHTALGAGCLAVVVLLGAALGTPWLRVEVPRAEGEGTAGAAEAGSAVA